MVIRFATATLTETNGQTQTWFNVNNKSYSIVDHKGKLALLNVDGSPVSLKKSKKLFKALTS